MEYLHKAMENMESLETRVKQLEVELKAKDELIQRLSQELPGTSRKLVRLGISEMDRVNQGGETKKNTTTTTSTTSTSPNTDSDGKAVPPSQSSSAWSAELVRNTFIKFFEERKHKMWPSSPCIPFNDPSVLFCPAGMFQFKQIFLGQIDPSHPMAKLSRACNSQKCIRAGGKHNDLEDVGKDVYHHTFFEMLGNWSFGDYFKKEAIEWSVELLTKVFGLDKNRLYATYFGGKEEEGVEPDYEARDLWYAQGFPPERVMPFDDKDNWWSAGDVGPCGPCSELHYDRVGNRDASHLVNMDDPNVLEIWNLVFMQYNRRADGTLELLPAKHVDTGMGFERMLSILQDKTSNYDTDLFTPLFAKIQELADHSSGSAPTTTTGNESAPGTPSATTIRPYAGKVGDADAEDAYIDKAYRVVADHIRTLSFAIADGCVPSNEGRGYVLRRILRRAVRFGTDVLNLKPGFMSALVPTVVDVLGTAYPELVSKQTFVQEVLDDEESSFQRTLKKGSKFFAREVEKLKAAGETEISGKEVFYMYSTHGFPSDLTTLMAEERGMTVDVEGFEKCMEAERIASAQNSKKEGDLVVRKLGAKETDALDKLGVEPTVEDSRYEWYKNINATIRAIFDPSSEEFVDSVEGPPSENKDSEGDIGASGNVNANSNANSNNRLVGIILDRSNFYFEAGGQQWDEGTFRRAKQVNQRSESKKNDNNKVSQDEEHEEEENASEVIFDVSNCQSSKGYIVHSGLVRRGEKLSVGDRVSCHVDYERRRSLASNHTCTHLLNFGLRKRLGPETDQKGSLVAPDRLRFDFNNSRPVSASDLVEVERIVQSEIASAKPVHSKVVPLADAMSINSLRAVFGDTYPDPVRVISIGTPVEDVVADPTNEKWQDYSIELCGGTHLRNSSDAKSFALIMEEAIAKGIRRATAVTGEPALQADSNADLISSKIEDAKVKGNGKDIVAFEASVQEIQKLLTELPISVTRKMEFQEAVKEMNKKLTNHRKEQQTLVDNEAKEEAEKVLKESLDSFNGQGSLLIPFMCPKAGANPSKLLKTVEKNTKKTKIPVSFCALAKDAGKDTVVISAIVHQDHVSKGISAMDWVNTAAERAEGKGGGKENQASGSGKLAFADAACDAAKKYANEKSVL